MINNIKESKLELRKKLFEKEYKDHNFNWKAGSGGFTGLCPEHQDHNPSFAIFEKNNKIYSKCFACDFDFFNKFKDKFACDPIAEAINSIAEQSLQELIKRSKNSDDSVIKYLNERRKIDIDFLVKSGLAGIIPENLSIDAENLPEKFNDFQKYKGQLVFFYRNQLNKINGFKFRLNVAGELEARENKKNVWLDFSKPNEAKLFGNENSSEKFVYLQEGEFDALSTLQFCAKNGIKNNIFAVSGTGGFKRANEYFSSQKYKVVNVPDTDVFNFETRLKEFANATAPGSYFLNLINDLSIKDIDEYFASEKIDEKEKAGIFSKELNKIDDLKNAINQAIEKEREQKLKLLPAQVLKILPTDSFSKKLDNAAMFKKPAPLKFVFAGFREKTVGILAGAGGGGKSYLALSFILSYADISKKLNYLNLFNNLRGASGYLTLEDDSELIHHRLYNLYRYFQIKPGAELLNNFEIASLYGQDFRLVKKTKQGGVEINKSAYDYLYNFCKNKKFVALDTLKRLAGGLDENNNSEMGELLRIVEKISFESGAAILILHHVNKTAADDKTKVRGASNITDDTRFTIMLKKAKDELELSFEKVNAIKTPESIPLTWQEFIDPETLEKYSMITKKED